MASGASRMRLASGWSDLPARVLRWAAARAVVPMLRLRNVGRPQDLAWLALAAAAILAWLWFLWTAPIAKK